MRPMFCDLVDSTKLSSQLDPEDYREVVRQYQRVCSEVIRRYDGHVAQYLGDGLLVYFGFPQAHEDDAQRAVRTGLGIIDAIGTLNTRLEPDKGVELAIRLGIHTGLVVVGDMGSSGRQEQLALGETPNLSARIQGIAQPDTVVMSADTHRLVQGYFDCDALGEHDLRGVSQPIAIYRVLQASGAQSRLDVVAARGLTPLVGREREVGLLLDRWEQTKDSQGQVVLLSGEAGIGKSRLVQVLKDHVSSDGLHTQIECRSLPYFTNTALYPITDFLQRTLRFQSDDTPEQKLEKLIENLRHYRLPLEETVPLFGALLSLPVPEDQYPPLNLSPQRQRQKTLESIVAIILELAERQPVLFILEDLHWTDPTTLELLELLIDQTPTTSLYVLVTCRPEFQPPWQHRSYLTEMTVNRLSRDQIERMAEQVAGEKRLPDEIVQQLVDKTDGVPLYVEEMTKAVLESGMLKEADGQYELIEPLSSLAIPMTLHDSLMSRLDRLVTAKAVAQYASVIGRQFSYELLREVSPLDEATLQRELGRLVEAELIYQRGLPPQAMYTFKHALVQYTAYESLLRSTRQGYHQRIAHVLTERFPETAATQPELLAHHYTQAGLNEQAIGYWQHAGDRAIQRSAHVEAIGHLKKGLELLASLPATPARCHHELAMQVPLGRALLLVQGFAAPEVERVFSRARVLCQHLGDTPQLIPVLNGLWNFHVVRNEFQMAYELAEQLCSFEKYHSIHLLGYTLFYLGKLTSACEYLETSIAFHDAQRDHLQNFSDRTTGVSTGIGARSYASWVLWLLGYPDQAHQRRCEALSQAHERSLPVHVATHLYSSAGLHQFCQDSHAVQEQVEPLITLASEQQFAFLLTSAMIWQGWALTMQGQSEEGIAQLRQGLTSYQATGAVQKRPYFLAMLVEAYKKAEQIEEGLIVLAEALAFAEKTEECWYEAELHRLKGQLLLQQSPDNATEAESCFQQAITIAQNQSAKSWELRSATSLARLWQSQGKRDEAYDLLAPVYNWFTEGFDTADLKDAKALLDELQE